MARVEQELTVRASRDEVFSALVDPDRLTRWFAEHAEVSLDDARFDFWGRYTPHAPDREGGRHSIRDLEAGRVLAFDWQLKGRDTQVRIELETVGEGTRLRLTHENLKPWEGAEFSVGDYWEATLENLRALVEGRSVGYRHDFADAGRAEVRVGVSIVAPAAEVFNALVDPRQLVRYFPDEAEFDAREGGAIDFHWQQVGPREVCTIDAPRRLVYSWNGNDGKATVVHWELEESAGTTHLTIVHSGFEKENLGYWLGWADVANSLKNMLESGAGWQRTQQVERDC